MKLLDPDSLVGRLFLRLMDLIVLNVLWLVTSLPVVTLGASTAALWDVAMKMALEEEGSIFKSYFRSFARHFWRATGLFLTAVAAGAFIALDYWAVGQTGSALGMVSYGLILASAYLYLAVLSHAFPTLVWFGGGVWATVKDAFRWTMANGIHGVWIVGLNVLPAALGLFFPEIFVRTSFFWMTLGVALCAWFIALRLTALFDPEKARAARRKEL